LAPLLVHKRHPLQFTKIIAASDRCGLLLNRDLLVRDFASAKSGGPSGIDRKSVLHNY
jgi:hypothetical protein